jgi:hypothetical protein
LCEASRLGVPRLLLARMAANVVLEGAVGAVPFAGAAYDIFFRANRRNVYAGVCYPVIPAKAGIQ